MADKTDPRVEAALIEAYADELKAGIENGAVVISRSEHDEATVEAFVVDPANAEKVTVYNQHDGTASRVNLSMLASVLKKRLPRVTNIPKKLWGKRAFNMAPPAGLTPRAELKCWLHEDSERRAEMNAFGLQAATCTKANLPSVLDVRLHVERKHPQSWKIIRELEERARLDEDRALRREEVAAMKAMAAAAAVPGKRVAAAKEE